MERSGTCLLYTSDDIYPFYAGKKGRSITFVIEVDDQPGVCLLYTSTDQGMERGTGTRLDDLKISDS